MIPARKLEPSENTFETIVVDVTHRCNMTCANCYLPDRTKPDMDIGRLKEFLLALPCRTNIRIAGAEPTLRKDLTEIIAIVREAGHRAVLLTNGLRLSHRSYVEELRSAGLRHVYISLNGADNDDWYEAIDGMRCAQKKLSALDNAMASRLIVNTGTILVRGLNEQAIPRMLSRVASYQARHALLRFKNVGAIGRYDQIAEEKNLTLPDLEQIAGQAVGHPSDRIRNYNRFKGKVEPATRLFPTDMTSEPGQGLWIKLTDWQASKNGLIDAGSQRRGRLTYDFKVAPFFEDVRGTPSRK
ncbi:MAG: radical SAM protein [Roseibium sp.]|uniref:radical SAM protein n=1 Tax=Roseibium sp. TaxID=1936156 RepID=UPI0026329393|nr:radical SAM protein [Roseibium sp.]MCV0424595.1 radical SAM protein [Roseibium sp.]